MPGRPILVVEDEPLVAMEIAAVLEEHGWRVLGPAATSQAAMALIDRERPAAALLDVVLDQSLADQVLKKLRASNVPVVLVTGVPHPEELSQQFAGLPRLEKPFGATALIEMLERLVP